MNARRVTSLAEVLGLCVVRILIFKFKTVKLHYLTLFEAHGWHVIILLYIFNRKPTVQAKKKKILDAKWQEKKFRIYCVNLDKILGA